MGTNIIKWSDWIKIKENLSASAERFLQSVEKLEPAIVDKKIGKSDWSAKDVLSHIVGWDIEVVRQFNIFIVDPDADDNYDIDTFNRKSVSTRSNSSLDEVIDEFKTAQKKLSETMSELTEENIRSDSRFVEWTKILTDHYDYHRVKLEKY